MQLLNKHFKTRRKGRTWIALSIRLNLFIGLGIELHNLKPRLKENGINVFLPFVHIQFAVYEYNDRFDDINTDFGQAILNSDMYVNHTRLL